MTRLQRNLAILLVVQIALIVWTRAPIGSAESVDPRPLLPGLDDADVARISLESVEGERVTLESRAGDWVLAEAGGYPVDASKVEALLDSLTSLRIGRPVVTRPVSHGALEVANDRYQTRLRIWSDAASDRPAAELVLGTSPNFRTRHVRTAEDDDVYEVRALTPSEVRVDPSDWIVRDLVEVDADRVRGFRIENAAGSIELERVEDGWRLVEPTGTGSPTDLDGSAVDAFVRRMAALTVVEPVGAVDDRESAEGLGEDAVVVRLRVAPEDGDAADPQAETVVLRIAPEASGEAGHHHATRDGFGFVGTVRHGAVAEALDATVETWSAEGQEEAVDGEAAS